MILSSDWNFTGNSSMHKVYYNDRTIHGGIKHDTVLRSPGQADLICSDWVCAVIKYGRGLFHFSPSYLNSLLYSALHQLSRSISHEQVPSHKEVSPRTPLLKNRNFFRAGRCHVHPQSSSTPWMGPGLCHTHTENTIVLEWGQYLQFCFWGE